MSSKILIGDVSMPFDSRVENRKIFEALKNRGCLKEDIDYIHSLIRERNAFDFSGYSGITTIVVPRNNLEDTGYCIKISDNPSELYENSIMCNLMAKYKFSSNVVKYYKSMKEYLKQHQYRYVSDDVIIHGDYNPRNVFAKNSAFAGMVDFADTCFGDRHYDIYFSMWTVALYSGIIGQEELVSECENIFLDAYGRDKIDDSRMDCVKN